MNKHNLTIGQKLYRPGKFGKPGTHMIIEKIGRKWATLTPEGRVDITADVLKLDGWINLVIYSSEAAYKKAVKLSNEWSSLAQAIGKTMGRVPAGIDVDKIKQARILLNLSE